MFELLAAYLEAAVTPEQKTVCLDACEALVECGVTAHHFAIEQELAILEQNDGDVLMAIVNHAVLPTFHAAFNQLGLVVNREASVADCTDLLRAMDRLDSYDDADLIVRLCESDNAAVDVLAELLELTGEHPAEHYLGLLEYVNGGLLLKLVEECENRVLPETARDVDGYLTVIKARLIKFLQLPAVQVGASTLVEAALTDHTRLGSPIDHFTAPFHDRLLLLTPDRLARELVGLVLATNTPDGLSEVQNVVRVQAADLVHDVQMLTAVDVATTKLLKQVYDAQA